MSFCLQKDRGILVYMKVIYRIYPSTASGPPPVRFAEAVTKQTLTVGEGSPLPITLNLAEHFREPKRLPYNEINLNIKRLP